MTIALILIATWSALGLLAAVAFGRLARSGTTTTSVTRTTAPGGANDVPATATATPVVATRSPAAATTGARRTPGATVTPTTTRSPEGVPADVAVAAHGLRAIADVLVGGMDSLRSDWNVMAPELRASTIESLIDQGTALRAVLDDLVHAAPSDLATTLDDLGGARPLGIPSAPAIA